MYSPWEATHRCMRRVHPSKQFCNWFCAMAFRAAVVTPDVVIKMLSFQCFLYLREQKKVTVDYIQ
jgi:hypothetical protein